MMYIVFNPEITIMVDCRENSFLVEDLESREIKVLPHQEFYGSSFKYEGDFFRKFLGCFKGKETLILTNRAKELYLQLQLANREDIF